ncbi:hypothetical protein CEXT_672561 [Caerostris extrusa]|uniref:Ig-like domain-containing protein n=1 Tax=Caerostris extrusa TaxID=172846 RepID=A0AAV4N622_CAEEX|nr:hypothetical protein CEXT_672561 [Caerostris extrusa]
MFLCTAPLIANMNHAKSSTLDTFNCNVTGYPVHAITWKNAHWPLQAECPKTYSTLRHHGMYQCFLYNDLDGGTAELKISDILK